MPHIGEKSEALPSKRAAGSITVGASPYSYTATSNGMAIVAGGTVSSIEYGRNGVYTDIGVIAGVVPTQAFDVVRVTYTVAPTMTFVPF